MARGFELLYRRLGPAYLRWTLAVLFMVSFVVVAGGVGMLWLYVDLTGEQFLLILTVAEAVTLVDTVITLALALRLLQPADRWLRGERTPRSAVAAWRVLTRLPLDLLRTSRVAFGLVQIVVISLFIVDVLGEPVFPALPILVAGSAIVLLYEAFLRFFGIELMARPVLADVSRDVPDRVAMGEATVPLKWRLLVALPAMNVITGVVVAGIASRQQGGIDALGWGVAAAIVVAFTLSLGLSLLLLKSILGPLNDLRRGTARVAEGDLSARVAVATTDEIGRLAGAFNDMVAGLAERERLREAFGTFVDPEVAERVLEEGTMLEGDEVDVTVLFLDIRGFTAYAERASAREVVARLNGFYERVVPVLVRHGGHADKFVGDGLLGVFGAPGRLDDHADRAVAASIEIAGVVEEGYRGDLRIGIGVNSGTVLAGTIGGGGRLEFTVIGDAVNTAARVERVTRETGDTILVTGTTRGLLRRDHGGFVERPPAVLRGRREPVALYAPAATAAAEPPLAASPAGRAAEPPLAPPAAGRAAGRVGP
jgi:class 3 adenylate cyclase